MAVPAPLVSILIPSYKPRHFEIALTSALAQAYERKEIIVSDDCPTEAIQEICARYPHVRYSRNPDRGPNTNLQRLTRIANGEFVKYLLDDDILHPLCVSRMVQAFGSDPTVKLVFSPRDRIDADNRLVSQQRSLTFKGPQERIAGRTLRRHCIMNLVNVIGEFTTVMFRRADVVRPDRDLIYTSYHGDPIAGLTDIATFLQLCETGDAVYISDALSMFRVHGDANSAQPDSSGFAAGLGEWALFTKHACADPAFSNQDRRLALATAKDRLSRWTARFPQLAEQIALLDGLSREFDEPAIRGVEPPAG